MRPRALDDQRDGRAALHRILVDPLRRQRVEDVRDGRDPRLERGCAADDLVRIPASVPTLVMASDDGEDRGVRHPGLPRDFFAVFRMPPHYGELLLRELSRLVQDLERNGRLAEIVKQPPDRHRLREFRAFRNEAGCEIGPQQRDVQRMDERIFVPASHAPETQDDLRRLRDLPGERLPLADEPPHGFPLLFPGDDAVVDILHLVERMPREVGIEPVDGRFDLFEEFPELLERDIHVPDNVDPFDSPAPELPRQPGDSAKNGADFASPRDENRPFGGKQIVGYSPADGRQLVRSDFVANFHAASPILKNGRIHHVHT